MFQSQSVADGSRLPAPAFCQLCPEKNGWEDFMGKISSLARAALLLSASLWCLWFVNTLYAQSGLSSVRGEISDPQGRAIAGATVTLKNPERNLARVQNTNEKGSHVFSALLPGVYRIEVEASGFKRLTIDGVRAQVDQPTIASVRRTAQRKRVS